MNSNGRFWGVIPLFIMGHFSHHILTTVTVPLIPFIRSDFNLDYTQAGFVVSAFTLAYGIGQLPAGWLADRIEPRLLMTIGISGVAIAGFFVGLSQTYLLLILSLVLMGILGGGYHPATPPLISAAVKPEHLGRSLGLHNIGGGASHFITPIIAVVIAGVWGWKNAFIWISLPTAVFGVIFYILLGRLLPRGEARAGVIKDGTPASFPGNMRRLVVFIILTTSTAALMNSTMAFIPLLFVDQLGLSKELAAVLLSVIYAGAFWAGPLGGSLADRIGSVRVVLGVCFLAGPLMYLLTVTPYGWGLFLILLLLGMVFFARMAASESFVIDNTPLGIRSTVLGIYYFSSMEGSGVLTPVIGYLIDHLGFQAAFAVAGGVSSLMTIIFFFWLEGAGGRHKR